MNYPQADGIKNQEKLYNDDHKIQRDFKVNGGME